MICEQFYKSDKTRVLIESAGAELMYLPKYLPDLNPTEKCWMQLKTKIEKAPIFCENFDEIMTYIFCENRCQKTCNSLYITDNFLFAPYLVRII